ncbi:hypothetical protein ACH495_29550 [Micromonospora sp. NPDC018662]|uniref:hypothetical protein n=1 Tax=Micromonospora sp. NPDC018662 TaxID=3364238 RepID=UPI0037933D57
MAVVDRFVAAQLGAGGSSYSLLVVELVRERVEEVAPGSALLVDSSAEQGELVGRSQQRRRMPSRRCPTRPPGTPTGPPVGELA